MPEEFGMIPFVSTPEPFAAMMKSETARYAAVIKAANVTAD